MARLTPNPAPSGFVPSGRPHLLAGQYSRALDRLVERVLTIRAEVGRAWPYHADPVTGRWTTTEDGEWCAGHWIEALRIAGERTGDRGLVMEARARTEQIRPKLERDDMYRAPRFYYSAARLSVFEGDRDMRTLALAAAYAVRSMAMPANGAMPIGTQVQVRSSALASRSIVAVDNVYPNLILDWWAYGETGDDIFIHGALRHLDLTARDFLRADGSTVEFIEYDRAGTPLREFTLLGAHDKSCWSRGQAWAIGGYLRAFEAVGEKQYLRVAERLLNYWWERTGPAAIPPYDFDDPAGPPDSSAAAILAESIARLAVLSPEPSEASDVLAKLEPLLDALVARLTPVDAEDSRPPGMLLDGCFNRPARVADDAELLWGDFYLLSALHCLERGGLPC